jgi:hypothetical protein
MMAQWTYGAEFELSDWDRRAPCAWDLDLRDVTMVNSCGVAVDPRGELFHLGGEVLARPADSPSGVADQLDEFLRGSGHEKTTVNYRSNLHVHVRAPGLRENLAGLKRAQQFCARWLPEVLPLIEPIPEPTREEYPDAEAYRGARKRYARRRVSHQKIMPEEIVGRQTRARTPREFFDAEVLHVPTGRLLWAIRPRCAVNLRQLLQTDTIEFRHFPGTLSSEEVRRAGEWCGDFLRMALENDGDPTRLWRERYADGPWPRFCSYRHDLEVGYLETAAHLVGREAARAAIERILTRSTLR